RLVAGGEEPPLLAMAETWHPRSVPVASPLPAALRSLRFVANKVRDHMGIMLSGSPRQAIRDFRRNGAVVKEMILHRDIYRGDWYLRNSEIVKEASCRAASRYTPPVYPGDLVIYIAGNLRVEPDADTRLEWSKLARGRSVVVRSPAPG